MNLKSLSFSLLAGVALVAVFSCNNEKPHGGNAVITGKFSNTKGDTLYLVDVNKNQFTTVDSVITKEDGSFEIYPTLTQKGFYNIYVGHSQAEFATVILDAGDTLEITGDAKNLGYTWSTKGVHDSKRFEELNHKITEMEKKKEPYKNFQDSLLRVFQVQISMNTGKDSLKNDSLDKVASRKFDSTQVYITAIDKEGAAFARKFVDEDSMSYANIAVLHLLDPFYDFRYFEKVANSLEVKYKSVANVKSLRDFVEQERPLSLGKPAPDISLPDQSGKIIHLSDLKGKVVLLDFWASWCAPCRAELPNVVANYKKHHDQGFDVFSVSLDTDPAAWKKEIKKQNMTWPWQVMDEQDQQRSFALKYRVKSIPRTFLVDANGMLIGRDLRDRALTEKLDELFAQAKTE